MAPGRPRIGLPAVLLAALAGLPAVAAGDPVLEAFVDGFEQLNPARWYLSHGWSNGPWQNCTWSKAAAQVADGVLRLSFAPQIDGSFLCGEVQTRGRAQYGTFGMRGRVQQQSGLNAAFFTYIGPVHGQPHDEIDIELLTRDPGTISLNTYVGGKPAHGATAALSPAADIGWHDYAFRWEAGGVTWFVDGREVYGTPAGAAPDTLPSHPQKIYLSLWGTGTLTDWMGPFTPPPGPVWFDVDCVWYMPDAEAGATTARAARCP